jgi:hypothetical protein
VAGTTRFLLFSCFIKEKKAVPHGQPLKFLFKKEHVMIYLALP